jgi:hypothetical protein
MRAGDDDDSGLEDITAALFLLGALFLGTNAIPPPYPNCGADPTLDDALGCASGCPVAGQRCRPPPALGSPSSMGGLVAGRLEPRRRRAAKGDGCGKARMSDAHADSRASVGYHEPMLSRSLKGA